MSGEGSVETLPGPDPQSPATYTDRTSETREGMVPHLHRYRVFGGRCAFAGCGVIDPNHVNNLSQLVHARGLDLIRREGSHEEHLRLHEQSRPRDRWSDKSTLKCRTCIFFVAKADGPVGRCRRRSPVCHEGWPAVFPDDDWCGDHKLAR